MRAKRGAYPPPSGGEALGGRAGAAARETRLARRTSSGGPPVRTSRDTIDDLTARLAAFRDEDLRGAAESAQARALLGEILASPPHRVRPRRRLVVPAAAVAVATATAVAVLLGSGSRGGEAASAPKGLPHIAGLGRARPALASL